MLGLCGKKIGMTQSFDEDGNLMPVTAIKVEPHVVVAERTPEKDGYAAVLDKALYRWHNGCPATGEPLGSLQLSLGSPPFRALL